MTPSYNYALKLIFHDLNPRYPPAPCKRRCNSYSGTVSSSYVQCKWINYALISAQVTNYQQTNHAG